MSDDLDAKLDKADEVQGLLIAYHGPDPDTDTCTECGRPFPCETNKLAGRLRDALMDARGLVMYYFHDGYYSDHEKAAEAIKRFGEQGWSVAAVLPPLASSSGISIVFAHSTDTAPSWEGGS